jgi:chemotaxis protein MotB
MSSFARARGRRRREGVDYWPGFVDALSTLVLVVVFLLAVFMMAQFFLSREVTGRDDALQRLNRQIAELTDLLSLERASGRSREDALAALAATLEARGAEGGRVEG